MHERNNVCLHDRFLLRHTSSQIDQRYMCPPWRHTQIPVELFDLLTAPPMMSVRLYRLHYEILQFYQYMIPNEAEHALRQQVVNHITHVIHQYLPSATVDVYGSYKTGLYLPNSDIDIIVHSNDKNRQWTPEELESIMSVLRDAFCRHHICTEDGIQIITSATVPIIKLTERTTLVKVDMSFNMNYGPQSAQLVLQYLKEYPYLKYLVYVLKQYILQLNLNEVWTGGISSYSLILMLVCFFQSYYKKDQLSLRTPSFHSLDDHSSTSRSYPSSSASCISSDENNPSDFDDEQDSLSSSSSSNDHVNLGHMLISFLELYGVYFNYVKLGIRVRLPNQNDIRAGFIDKDELFKNFCCGHRTQNNLCIVDPFNEKNDISKASWLTPRIQLAFREAYDKLLQSISEQNTTLKNAPSILSKIISISEQTIIHRKNLRKTYRLYTNYQQTLKSIQDGRINFNYPLPDKTLNQYTNVNPHKYPYQQQFYSSQNVSNRTQTQRKFVNGDDNHRNAQQ